MTTIPTFAAGNVVEATIVFTPETGTVDIANVTARLRKPGGTEVSLTGITAPGVNTFEVEWTSDDNDVSGIYQIRWESNPPSPKIVVEDRTTQFRLNASSFATP